MASSSRSLPERVSAVLSLRSTVWPCPEESERAISSHAFFRRAAAVTPAPRFGRLPTGGAGTESGGRFGGLRGPTHHRPATFVSEDGFETVSRGGRRHGGGGGGGGWTDRRHDGPSAPTLPTGPAVPVIPAGPMAPAVVEPVVPAVAKFSSAALRASGDVEDRMLARVKGKINRMGPSTYEATKVFMQQILSSDDTDFLDELMKYIFSKASTESAYCPLYAKLLHELGDEFPHFRTVIHTIFNDYIHVFKAVDMGVEPDPGSADRKAFVEAQERKRARRGYSQFVAELVKLGEADVEAFVALLDAVVSVIEDNNNSAEKTLLCEEYIDCFVTMCTSASTIMRTAPWSGDMVARLSAVSDKKPMESAGLSNKARFAIMGLTDISRAGWRV